MFLDCNHVSSRYCFWSIHSNLKLNCALIPEKEQNVEPHEPLVSDLCLTRTKSKTLGASTVPVSPAKPAAAKVLTDKV